MENVVIKVNRREKEVKRWEEKNNMKLKKNFWGNETKNVKAYEEKVKEGKKQM